MTHWMTLLVLIAAGCMTVLYVAAWRWNRTIAQLRSAVSAAARQGQTSRYHRSDLAGLPAPVQRYFQLVLPDSLPLIRKARLSHLGSLNMGTTKPSWHDFASTQLQVVDRPGFVWDARIAMAPGLGARVYDAYIAGQGLLHASLLGVITVADQSGRAEMAQGELLRFLAEAVWYPTALLPSQGVGWAALDDSSAVATLADGGTTVSLTFRFGADGLVEAVDAEQRYRSVGSIFVATPWHGQFWSYAERNGVQIPLQGEVAWMLPEGAWPYWKGHIQSVEYDFAS